MKVIATVQSEGNEPVNMLWCRNGDDLSVLMSVAQLLQQDKDEAPFTPRVRTITIEVS